MVTLSGSSTHMTRGAWWFEVVAHVVFQEFETGARVDSGRAAGVDEVADRRGRVTPPPHGRHGGHARVVQPLTWPSSTSLSSLRLLVMVYSTLRRANSILVRPDRCPGSPGTSRTTRGCSRTPDVQMEWVMVSMASDWPWAQSYMG